MRVSKRDEDARASGDRSDVFYGFVPIYIHLTLLRHREVRLDGWVTVPVHK